MNFYQILHIITQLDRTKIIDKKDIDKALKVKKYILGLRNYGMLPTLTILDEYEKKQEYEECSYIMEALMECKKNSDSDHFPTSLEQYTDEDHKKLFAQWGLTGEIAKANNDKYVQEIKKL